MRADNGAIFDVFYITPDGDVLTAPLRSVIFDNYVRGRIRTEQVRLMYYGDQYGDLDIVPAMAGLEFGLVFVGDTWRNGKEINSEGFLSARILPDGEFSPLTSTSGLYIGDMEVGEYVDLELKLEIPEPYPITETTDIRHGVMYCGLGFVSGNAVCDPAAPSIYLFDTFGSFVYSGVGDPSLKESNPKDMNWLLFRTTVFTAAEALSMADIFEFPDGD